MRTKHIYCLIDPHSGEIRYIGQTGNLYKRLLEHCRRSEASIFNDELSDWIYNLNKYGTILSRADRPEIYNLETVPANEVNFWEQYYVDLYRSWGFQLFNKFRKGKECEEETREKMRKAHNLDGRHPNYVLSDTQVYEIKKARFEGATLLELSIKYNQSNANISFICSGRRRANIAPEYTLRTKGKRIKYRNAS